MKLAAPVVGEGARPTRPAHAGRAIGVAHTLVVAHAGPAGVGHHVAELPQPDVAVRRNEAFEAVARFADLAARVARAVGVGRTVRARIRNAGLAVGAGRVVGGIAWVALPLVNPGTDALQPGGVRRAVQVGAALQAGEVAA